MTPPTLELARRFGAPGAQAHASRRVNEAILADSDLIVTMTRQHRREVVGLDPRTVKRTFTLRELTRILWNIGGFTPQPSDGAAPGRERLLVQIAHLSRFRGVAGGASPASTDDDVIDPYGQSAAVYERSAGQILPGIEALASFLRAGFKPDQPTA